MLSGTYDDIYHIILNAYLYQYPDIREFVKQYSIFRFDFVYWFATFVNKNYPIEPTYHQILNTLEELSVKYNIMSAFATGFQNRYNSRKRARDAADLAATFAVENAIAAKKRYTAPRIRITPMRSSNFTTKTGEIKGVDTALAVSPIPSDVNTNTAIIMLNGINQGSGSFNRVGRKVYPKSIRITGQAELNAKLEPTTSNYYGMKLRIVLVWDKQPNASAIPTYDVIFGHTDAIGNETANLNDKIRYDNMQRFKILMEETCIINPGSQGPTVSGSVNALLLEHQFDMYYKFKKGAGALESTYASTQTAPTPPAYTDIATGGLLVVFRAISNTSNSVSASTLSLGANTIARYRYTD